MARPPMPAHLTPEWYRKAWEWCRGLVLALWPIRVNILIAVLLSLGVSLVDQARDAHRVIVQDLGPELFARRYIVTFLVCVLVGVNIWYWSRTLLDTFSPTEEERRDPASQSRWPAHPWAVRWAPRVLGAMVPVGMAVGCILAALETRFTLEVRAERAGEGMTQQQLNTVPLWLAAGGWLLLAATLLVTFHFRRLKIDRKPGERKPGLATRAVRRLSAHDPRGSGLVRTLEHLPGTRWQRALFDALGIRELSVGAQYALLGGFVLGAAIVAVAIAAPGFAAGFSLGLGHAGSGEASAQSGVATLPIGPLATIMLAGSLWVVLLHPLTLLSIRKRFPLVLALLTLTVISGLSSCNNNHEIRFLDAPAGQAPPAPPGIADDFKRWIAERNPPGSGRKDFPVFVVVTEGGGIRAAYFTALTLSLLDQDRDFRDHLYAISGVSGGSVGASVYASLVQRDEANGSTALASEMIDATTGILAHDLLSPTLARAAVSDLALQFWPFCTLALPDRAIALERAFEEAVRSITNDWSPDRSFYRLRQPTAAGTTTTDVPALVLNTTRVETGERIIISHVRLNDETLPVTPTNPAGPTMAPRSLWECVPRDLRLSTAAFLSARFPIVTPVGRFRGVDGRDGRIRTHKLADGGYFENSAAATGLDIVQRLQQVIDSAGPGEPAHGARIRVILLRFRDAAVSDNNSFDEVGSPLRTMLNTRSAHGERARDMLEQWVAARADALCAETIKFEIFSATVPIPLGWVLSTAACESINRQLGWQKTVSRKAPTQAEHAATPAAGDSAPAAARGREEQSRMSNLAARQKVGQLIRPAEP